MLKKVSTITMTAGIILVIFFIFSCKQPVEPVSTNYHNKILFSSSRSGIPQLYVMNPDGTDIQQITSGKYFHGEGRWSPDAKQIVCVTDENTDTGCYNRMELMNANGTYQRLLYCGSQMVWFPTGERIFYTYCPSCEIGIYNATLYSIDAQGNNKIIVSHDFGGDITFSPDGKTIAYVYTNSSDSIPNPVLKLIDYPTLSNTRVVGPKGVMVPFWSPNGQEIVFSSPNGGANINGVQVYNIFIMNSDGTNVRRITNHTTSEHYLYPRWSPDGSKIIFIALVNNPNGHQQSYLYMVDKNGSNLHKVIDDATVITADWSK